MKFVLKRSWLPVVAILIMVLITVASLLKTGGGEERAVNTAAENSELTVIIDAGHGGADGGAVSLTGAKESTVNLEIALRLDEILGFFGVRTVMTRTVEELDYSEKADTIRAKKAEDQIRRLKLINAAENAVLLSIHQNNFPSGSPFGAQVLYAPTSGSKEFAEAMQLVLKGTLNDQNRRTAAQAPKSILLMNHITCPALLIECGFLSNPEEEKLLMSDDYRLKVAAVIAGGYLNNRQNLMQIDTGGSDEGKNSILLY